MPKREDLSIVKRTLVALLAVTAATAPAARAADIFEKVGTIGAQYLKIPIGARAAGMGDAFVSVSDDATAVFWNAAGVARLSGTVVSINHTAWAAQTAIDQATVVFAAPLLPGNMAFNARSFTMDPFEVVDVFHQDGTGTFTDAGDTDYALTYARSLTDKFSAGASLHYVSEGLADIKAHVLTYDFGTLYDTGFHSVRIGMTISNMGSNMQFLDRPVKVPTIFRVGLSANLYNDGTHSLLSAVDFSHPPDNKERLNMGAEYNFRDYFFLRGGYKLGYDSEKYAAGAGFKFPIGSAQSARLDYAWSDLQTLGAAQRVSLELGF